MARQSRLPPFLLTRPAAQANRFSTALRNRFGADIDIVDSPLLAPRFLVPELPELPYRALLFTSETGVQAFARISAEPGLAKIQTAWCVGDRTAQAARAIGLHALSAGGNAQTLASAVIAAGQQGPLLHIRGQDAYGDLKEVLNSSGIETISVISYMQNPQPLSAEALAVLGTKVPMLVPLFSPRTARLFVAQIVGIPIKASLWIAALSPAVAGAAAPLPLASLDVAAKPDEDAMIEALARLIAAGQHA